MSRGIEILRSNRAALFLCHRPRLCHRLTNYRIPSTLSNASQPSPFELAETSPESAITVVASSVPDLVAGYIACVASKDRQALDQSNLARVENTQSPPPPATILRALNWACWRKGMCRLSGKRKGEGVIMKESGGIVDVHAAGDFC
ncbi:hypothetical protein J3R82DRAFT_3746 [Butyriboletus roseoflavus]|nr:hypothetical protein J3R82DRAFT_3746 [Butyriboletus roseoflavus]